MDGLYNQPQASIHAPTIPLNPLRTTCQLVQINEVSIFKQIRDIVRMDVSFLRVNSNIYNIDSDWLPKYKCHVINHSEMVLERAVDFR